MRALAGAVLALLAACGQSDVESRRAGIVGGSNDDGDPSVLALLSSSHTCSASLISPHVLITAAHCATFPEPPSTFHVYVGTDLNTDASLQKYAVKAFRADPRYTVGQLSSELDIGLILTDEAVAGTPLPLRRVPIDDQAIGQTARVVGFGLTSGNAINQGRKREAELVVTGLRGAAVRFEVTSNSPSICHGDSGGPTFFTGSEGEEIAAVIARSDAACSDWSESAILDEEALRFIDGVVAEIDPPAPDLATNAASPGDQGCAMAGHAEPSAIGVLVLAALSARRGRSRRRAASR